MLSTVRKGAMAVAGIGALALGGSAIAGAADSTRSSGPASYGAYGPPGSPGQGGPQRQPLSSDNAAKVKAAALDKVPGATVLQTEAGGPYGTPYHAHIRKAGGTRQVVLVDGDFKATAVQADRGRGGKGRGGPGGPGGPGGHDGRGGPGGGRGETALTGDTKQKVEAAVLAKYSGATIVRTETNRGSSAPYESHITTSDGKELEVLVSKEFKVVEANERPARP